MKCPKCGYHRKPRDQVFVPATECPACGIVYAKYTESEAAAASVPPTAAGPAKKPSPVHEASLRQARDRVEMRLRYRAGARLKDERRARTLERARLFTAEAMRRRQETQQGRNHPASSDDVPQPPPEVTMAAEPSHGEPPLRTPAPAEPPADLVETADVSGQEVVGTGDGDADRDEWAQDEDRSGVAAASPTRRAGRASLLTRLLPAVSWLILVAGVVGAILSWTTIGDVQAGAQADAVVRPDALPIALLLGFAYLATGVLGFAFFWVTSMISGQLTDIRRLLLARMLLSTTRDDDV